MAMAEERIVQRLQQIAMSLAPFKVELKDFGSAPSHSIFINVTSKLPLQHAISEFRQAQHLMKLTNDQKPHFIEEPCVMIAGKLKNWQYEKAWEQFSHRNFTGRFIADSVLLLKKAEGSKRYEIVRRLDFMNIPIAVRQGELFA